METTMTIKWIAERLKWELGLLPTPNYTITGGENEK
jgi:hypothetical protein